MANKQQEKFSKISKHIKFISFIALLAALLIPFAPAITWTVTSSIGEAKHTVYGTAFNFMFTNVIYGPVQYKSFGIAVLPLISYILILGSAILLGLHLFHKKFKTNPLFIVGVFALALTAAILVLTSHPETARVLADALIGKHDKYVVETIIKNTSLSFGFVGMSVFGFITAFGMFLTLFLDGVIDNLRARLIK